MKKFLILFILCTVIKDISAQMVKPTSGFILSERYDSSFTLKKGDYIVQGEVVFSKTAIITIEAGVKVFFMPGATINVKGGLQVKGDPNSLVQFSSAGGKESGTGLVITGTATNQEIAINYASFKYLLKPLVFEKDWYRKGVDINNSDFFNTYEFNDAVSIKEVDFYLNKEPLDFTFTNNVFADNYSNLSVYNATSYRVRYKFEKNVFANNFYFDSRSKAESNPVYAGLDDIQGKFVMKMYDNAFSDNFIFSQDSLKLINHGTVGFLHPKADFEIQNNFSRNKVEKTYQQSTPNYALHAFPMRVSIDGKDVSQEASVDSFVDKKITVHFNIPIARVQNEYKIFFNFIDTVTGEILKKQIDKNYQFINSVNTEAEFSFDNTVLTEPIGYISIENLKNIDGVSVPSINLGVLDFFAKCGSRSYKMEYVTLTPVDISKVNLKLVDTTRNLIIELDSVRVGKWEGGIFAGVSGYAGDLNHDWFHQEKWYKAFGVKVRYHFNRNIAARFSLDYTNVMAKDYGLYYLRNLNFKSKLISAFVMCEYSFTDRYKSNKEDKFWRKKKFRVDQEKFSHSFSLGRRFYPSFGLGLGLVKFNPMGQYTDGKWYELRQFGLEGQTAPGGKKYSLLTLATPIMAGINYRLNNNIKIAFEFTAFKLFSDYLDDMSKVAYVDDAIIRAANPGNEEMASYFRNPMGYTTGIPSLNQGARGNPNNKDFFYNVGLSIWYRFNKKRTESDY